MYYVGYVAYFQLNIDYIVNTYCVNKDKPQLACNGKCHLKKQLQVSNNEDSNSEGISTLVESFFPVFYSEYSYNYPLKVAVNLKKQINLFYNQGYSFDFEYFHFKPPIV